MEDVDPMQPRKHERLTINKEFESFDAFIHEYVTNVSRGGVFIKSKTPLPVGTKVNLRFTLIMDDIETIEGTGDTTCTAAGSGGPSSDCTSSPFLCGPGLVCVNTGGASPVCLSWCRVASAGDCTGGLTCLSFSTPAIYKGTEYGVCN